MAGPQHDQAPEDRLVEEAVEHVAIAVARRVVARNERRLAAFQATLADLTERQRLAIEAAAGTWAMDVAAESAAVGVHIARHGGWDVPEEVVRRAYTWGEWIGGVIPEAWHLEPRALTAQEVARLSQPTVN